VGRGLGGGRSRCAGRCSRIRWGRSRGGGDGVGLDLCISGVWDVDSRAHVWMLAHCCNWLPRRSEKCGEYSAGTSSIGDTNSKALLELRESVAN